MAAQGGVVVVTTMETEFRGISDRADGTKHGDADRELQPMAAAHAAAFAAAFLRKLAEAEAGRAQRRPSTAGLQSAPGLGELLFSTRIDHPAGQLVVGFGAGDTLVVVEKNAAVHRWSLTDHRAGLSGMPRGEALRSGISAVASSARPAVAMARDRKLILVHFSPDGTARATTSHSTRRALASRSSARRAR